jgi:hypothetical protein
VFVELEIPDLTVLTKIIKELKHHRPDITHLDLAIEKTGGNPFLIFNGTKELERLWC